MFLSYGALKGVPAYNITFGTLDDWFTPEAGASFEGMFEMVQLDVVDLSYVDLNKVSNFSYMFEGYGQRIALSKEILQPFPGKITWPKYVDETGNLLPIKPAEPTAIGQEGANMSYMFLNYRMCGENQGNLLDLSNWDTSNVRNFQGMFSGFNGYKLLGGGFYGINVKFPESGLTTGAQANISYMFEYSNVYVETTDPAEDEQDDYIVGTVKLKLSDVIDTSQVINFSHLFDGMYSIETGRENGDSGRF